MKKVLITILVIAFVSSAWFWHALSPANAKNTKSESFVVASGESIGVIALHLHERGLIRSPFAFKTYARFIGVAGSLRAGAFALSPSQSVSSIIDVIHEGKTEEFMITIPEGYTVADIDKLLASKGLGQPGDIIDCAFTCDFATFDFLPTKAGGTQALGIGSRLEGYLFPETYSVSPAEYNPKFFLERMLGTFRTRIVNEYAGDMQSSGKTLHQLVTMASLVEEESRHDDERAVIAGILWKRLEHGIVLGVDATTRYVLKKKSEPLTKADVETDSKYNTRRNQGLPPSPIANAGASSFVAALNPKTSSYWYYLHDRGGIIRYAVTNEEHNVNRAKYLGN